jgi:hypothetical protein
VTGVAADFRRDWHRLWRVAEQVAAAAGAEPSSAFEDVGLFLERPNGDDRAGGYSSSPANATTFASTGGDGVHFGVLHTKLEVAAPSPVVMTVPMQFDDPNHIVGASLPEFLALGCVVGYHVLEQLAYDGGRRDLLSRLQSQRTYSSPEEEVVLSALTEEFQLRPWPDVESRLRELAAQFGDDIVLEDGERRD